MAGEQQLLLHDHPVSPYAQKVRLALREKGIPFNVTAPGSNANLLAANPRNEVPALVDGDFSVFDSSIIMSYIEDKFPEKPLLPPDAKGRAKARMIEEICDTQYEAINWGHSEVVWQSRATGPLKEKLLLEARRQTKLIQSWLEAQLGEDQDYFNGSTFGYADACVAPLLNQSVLARMGPEDGSALKRWYERIKELESVQKTFEEVKDGAKLMAGLRNAFQTPRRPREYRDFRLEWMIKSGGIDVVLQGLQKGNIRFCRMPNE